MQAYAVACGVGVYIQLGAGSSEGRRGAGAITPYQDVEALAGYVAVLVSHDERYRVVANIGAGEATLVEGQRGWLEGLLPPGVITNCEVLVYLI
jgi:hypothetical protein